MAETPIILSGHVYVFNSSTPVESVEVSIINVRTNERHDGNDTLFPELTTNAQGEFQANISNFTHDHVTNDVYKLLINHNGLKDVITITLGTDSITNLVMQPTPKDVYEYERSLDQIGDKVSIYDTSPTFDNNHGSIASNSRTLKDFGEDVYASIQPEEDEESQEEEGMVCHGVSTGYFKIRYAIARDDIIVSGTDEFRVADKPKKWSYKNKPFAYEVRLTRINT